MRCGSTIKAGLILALWHPEERLAPKDDSTDSSAHLQSVFLILLGHIGVDECKLNSNRDYGTTAHIAIATDGTVWQGMVRWSTHTKRQQHRLALPPSIGLADIPLSHQRR